MRLLATLFTPAEAELAAHLTLAREEAGAIAARAGLPQEVVARRLEGMAHVASVPDDPRLVTGCLALTFH